MENGGISILDLIIVTVLAVFFFLGYKKGFAQELVRIIGSILGLVFATRFMDVVADGINAVIESPTSAAILAFALIFLSVVYLFGYIIKKIKIINLSFALGSADKFIGGAFGLMKGAIFMSLITIVISLFAITPMLKYHVNQSQLFKPMLRIAPLAYDTFKVIVPKAGVFFREFEEAFASKHYENVDDRVENLIKYYRNGQ